VENGRGYRFYHYKKGLIKSHDVVFLKQTNQIIPIDHINFFQEAEDSITLTNTHLQDQQETDPHISGKIKRKYDYLSQKFDNYSITEINHQNSGSKKQRRPSIILKDHYVLRVDNIKGKFQFTSLKFQEIFNLNPKISKLVVYLPEVSKSGKVNLPLTFPSN
jgi:hypothetical protein